MALETSQYLSIVLFPATTSGLCQRAESASEDHDVIISTSILVTRMAKRLERSMSARQRCGWDRPMGCHSVI